MSNILAELIVAVGLLMGEPRVAEYGLPILSVESDCAVQTLYETGILVEANCPVDGEVAAVFVFGHIYLSDDIDTATLKGRAIVLHELVHFVQWKQGRLPTVPTHCEVVEIEQEAYDIEVKWIMQTGRSEKAAWGVLDIDPVWLSWYLSCDPVQERSN